MEKCLLTFINYQQNIGRKFFQIVEFAYNNANNESNGYTLFEFNFGYHFYILYKEDINLYLKSKIVDKLAGKLKDPMTLYQKNLYYI